jgi:hypothetical protein
VQLPQGNQSCRRATTRGVQHELLSGSALERAAKVHRVTTPLAPFYPPYWPLFSTPPTDSHPVPKHDAFNRAFNRLTPQTLEAINQAVIEAAVELGLEDGKKLRVDTTVDVATLCYTSLCLWKH